MDVTFWGTRGSVATAHDSAAIREKLVAALVAAEGRRFESESQAERFVREELPFSVGGSYGGETSCVQIESGGDEDLICDLGTGARRYAGSVLARNGPGKPRIYNVIMSHLHWDHVAGFPFFIPAYIPGNIVRIHACHTETQAALRYQHSHPGFPVDFDQLGAKIEFVKWEPDRTYELCGFRVTPKLQRHKGDSYGYRFEKNGKVIVYSSDSEHDLTDPNEADDFAAFFSGADVVIFDAMYTLADAVTIRQDWGHSSNMVGVELAHMARAKRLALFHHDPSHGDKRIEELAAQAVAYEELSRGDAPPLEIFAAYDGMVLSV